MHIRDLIIKRSPELKFLNNIQLFATLASYPEESWSVQYILELLCAAFFLILRQVRYVISII